MMMMIVARFRNLLLLLCPNFFFSGQPRDESRAPKETQRIKSDRIGWDGAIRCPIRASVVFRRCQHTSLSAEREREREGLRERGRDGGEKEREERKNTSTKTNVAVENDDDENDDVASERVRLSTRSDVDEFLSFFLLHYFSLRSRKDGRRAGIHRVRDQDPQISTHLQSSEASSSAAAAAKRIRRSGASASEDDLSAQLDGLVGGRQPQTSRPRHDGPVAEAALSGRRDSNRKLGVPGFLLTRENINPVVRLLVSCRLQNFVVFVKNSGVKIIQNSFCR